MGGCLSFSDSRKLGRGIVGSLGKGGVFPEGRTFSPSLPNPLSPWKCQRGPNKRSASLEESQVKHDIEMPAGHVSALN